MSRARNTSQSFKPSFQDETIRLRRNLNRAGFESIYDNYKKMAFRTWTWLGPAEKKKLALKG